MSETAAAGQKSLYLRHDLWAALQEAGWRQRSSAGRIVTALVIPYLREQGLLPDGFEEPAVPGRRGSTPGPAVSRRP